ncbi:MAG: carbohydrate kinase family protein [Candidatus Peribacteraceae bacterium]|nr:carbohydrate kinase family protein [Candidatus Peribacteraceae bacterium]
MKYLIHGSIAYDLLLHTEGSFADAIDANNLEKLSVSFLAQHLERHHGGTGANIAWNASLLGDEPMLVGAVGSDGGSYLELLNERGVDVSLVQKKNDAVTATAIIGTDNAERQITFFHPGADGSAGLPELGDLREEVDFGIVSARNPVLMLSGARAMRHAKIPYLFDPGQQSHVFAQDEFRHAVEGGSGLVVNEYEWELASKKLGWNEKEVLNACGLLVITLGERGIRIAKKDESHDIPACKVDHLKNPTGAGDAVRAALLYGLSRKWSLVDTGRLAAAMGSLVCEQEGTMLESVDWEMLDGRVFENYGERLPRS